MAIRSLTYLDIPVNKRRESAARTMARLHDRLNDPVLEEESRQRLLQEKAKIEQWVLGTLPNEG